jgi:hypothetical protein
VKTLPSMRQLEQTKAGRGKLKSRIENLSSVLAGRNRMASPRFSACQRIFVHESSYTGSEAPPSFEKRPIGMSIPCDVNFSFPSIRKLERAPRSRCRCRLATGSDFLGRGGKNRESASDSDVNGLTDEQRRTDFPDSSIGRHCRGRVTAIFSLDHDGGAMGSEHRPELDTRLRNRTRVL